MANRGNTDIAKQYREEYGWEMPTLKLARIIYKEHQLSFASLDAVRSCLRALENKMGKQNSCMKIKDVPERPKNPYNLPKSDETDYSPYIINDAKRVLLLCDLHVPYHSIEAISAVIDKEINNKPDCIILNGDLLDCHTLSKYAKNPKMRSFAEEIEAAAQVINILKKELCERIVFKYGNHEQRYEHFLWMKAKEILGLEDFELHNLLTKRCGKIETVKDKRIIKIGHLNVVHGHEFIAASGQVASVAKSFYDKGKACVIGGHHHKTSEFTAVSMTGEMTTTFSVGCLSELHPEYMPINSWNWGAATINYDGDYFHVHNYRIEKGKIY